MRWLTEHQLKSGTAQARRKAAAALCANPDAGAYRTLQAAVMDPDAEVRRLAVTALGKIEHLGRIELLLRALSDPEPAVLKAALSALKLISDSRVSAEVMPLLRHIDVGVRAAAAQALDAQGWKPVTVSDQVWFHVARGHFSQAASLGVTAVPVLDQVIQSAPYSIAVSAIQALDQITDASAVEPLLRALKSQDVAVCVAAADTIGRTGRKEAAEALLETVRHPESHVRLAVVEALGSLGVSAAAPRLVELLSDPVWEVRRAAIEALGRLRGPGTAGALAQCLVDPDVDVREASTVALGNLADPASIPALVLALADSASGVRRLAAAALSRIDENWMMTAEARGAATELAEAVRKTDSDARYFAAPLLARLTSSAPTAMAQPRPAIASPADRQKLAVSLFVGLLTSPDRDLRQAAAEALGRLREQRSETALMRALADHDEGVRAAVQQALEAIKGA